MYQSMYTPATDDHSGEEHAALPEYYSVAVHSELITKRYRSVLADDAQRAEVLACERFQREHPTLEINSVSAAKRA